MMQTLERPKMKAHAPAPMNAWLANILDAYRYCSRAADVFAPPPPRTNIKELVRMKTALSPGSVYRDTAEQPGWILDLLQRKRNYRTVDAAIEAIMEPTNDSVEAQRLASMIAGKGRLIEMAELVERFLQYHVDMELETRLKGGLGRDRLLAPSDFTQIHALEMDGMVLRAGLLEDLPESHPARSWEIHYRGSDGRKLVVLGKAPLALFQQIDARNPNQKLEDKLKELQKVRDKASEKQEEEPKPPKPAFSAASRKYYTLEAARYWTYRCRIAQLERLRDRSNPEPEVYSAVVTELKSVRSNKPAPPPIPTVLPTTTPRTWCEDAIRAVDLLTHPDKVFCEPPASVTVDELLTARQRLGVNEIFDDPNKNAACTFAGRFCGEYAQNEFTGLLVHLSRAVDQAITTVAEKTIYHMILSYQDMEAQGEI